MFHVPIVVKTLVTWSCEGFFEKMLIDPPKVAKPKLLALPGPRSTTAPPKVDCGKNEVEWCAGLLVSPHGTPSNVMLYWSSLKPRSVVLVSLRPGPLAESPDRLGAMLTMRLYSAVGATDSSINSRVMMDCGCVACELNCVGAIAEALPLADSDGR